MGVCLLFWERLVPNAKSKIGNSLSLVQPTASGFLLIFLSCPRDGGIIALVWVCFPISGYYTGSVSPCVEHAVMVRAKNALQAFGSQGTLRIVTPARLKLLIWVETRPLLACAHLRLQDDLDGLLIGSRISARAGMLMVLNGEGERARYHTTSTSAHFLL